jgi:hypothetical protein
MFEKNKKDHKNLVFVWQPIEDFNPEPQNFYHYEFE